MARKSTVSSINQHKAEIPHYFGSKGIKILLQTVHHYFSKHVGLRKLSNHFTTTGNTFGSSRSVEDHLQNLPCAQQEKQEHFLFTADNAENPNYLALVILYLFKNACCHLTM